MNKDASDNHPRLVSGDTTFISKNETHDPLALQWAGLRRRRLEGNPSGAGARSSRIPQQMIAIVLGYAE